MDNAGGDARDLQERGCAGRTILVEDAAEIRGADC